MQTNFCNQVKSHSLTGSLCALQANHSALAAFKAPRTEPNMGQTAQHLAFAIMLMCAAHTVQQLVIASRLLEALEEDRDTTDLSEFVTVFGAAATVEALKICVPVFDKIAQDFHSEAEMVMRDAVPSAALVDSDHIEATSVEISEIFASVCKSLCTTSQRPQGAQATRAVVTLLLSTLAGQLTDLTLNRDETFETFAKSKQGRNAVNRATCAQAFLPGEALREGWDLAERHILNKLPLLLEQIRPAA
jgi:hypothetical protein